MCIAECLCFVGVPYIDWDHFQQILDRLLELMKGTNRLQALMLCGQLVQKQLSWIYNIPKHNIFPYIIKIIRVRHHSPYTVSANFCYNGASFHLVKIYSHCYMVLYHDMYRITRDLHASQFFFYSFSCIAHTTKAVIRFSVLPCKQWPYSFDVFGFVECTEFKVHVVYVMNKLFDRKRPMYRYWWARYCLSPVSCR